MHVAPGEAVMSILDNRGALNNHSILERLQQLAEAETDEEKSCLTGRRKSIPTHSAVSGRAPSERRQQH